MATALGDSSKVLEVKASDCCYQPLAASAYTVAGIQPGLLEAIGSLNRYRPGCFQQGEITAIKPGDIIGEIRHPLI